MSSVAVSSISRGHLEPPAHCSTTLLPRDCPRKVEKDLAQGVRVGVMGADLEEEPVHQIVRKSKKKVKEKKVSRVVAF